MPFYRKLGDIPNKRHTVFRQDNGELYHEQLFGTIGFDGMSSLLYHIQPPTAVKEILGSKDISPTIAVERNLKMTCLQGFKVPPKKDFLESRTPVLVNNDVYIELASPSESILL